MEKPDLLAPANALSRRDANLARRHLGHADEQGGHKADTRVIRLNEEDRPCCHGGLICGIPDKSFLAAGGIVFRVAEAGGVRRFGAVEAWDLGRFDDGAAHRGVPAVIAQRAEIRLVNGAGYELLA